MKDLNLIVRKLHIVMLKSGPHFYRPYGRETLCGKSKIWAPTLELWQLEDMGEMMCARCLAEVFDSAMEPEGLAAVG